MDFRIQPHAARSCAQVESISKCMLVKLETQVKAHGKACLEYTAVKTKKILSFQVEGKDPHPRMFSDVYKCIVVRYPESYL